ncbi:unnamed protein product [Clonostachys byssicola]|uniref:Uncharacterized protein n=1 Tax=Clonostachys byssicola TaxID=160290 RepID=A0A9N9Y1E8_9HYPO|nr:unnamed protein product [Clonostachys byssicola]
MPSRYPPVSPDMLHRPETLFGEEDRSPAQFAMTRYYDSDSALNRTGDYRSSRRSYSTCCSKQRSVRGGIDLEPWSSRRSHSGSSLESHIHRRWSRRGVSAARACTCKKPLPEPDYIVFCPDPPFDRDAETEEDEEDDEEEEQGAGHGVAYPDNSTARTSPESFVTPDADDSIELREAGRRDQSGEPEDQWDEDSEATRHQAKGKASREVAGHGWPEQQQRLTTVAVMSALEHIRWSREHRAEPAYRPHKDRTRRSPRDE